MPEPVLDTVALAPDRRTELAEDLSIALLLTLDRLSPLERAAFLLHDVFDFSFSEVAPALERSEAACRQLAARARAHVRSARPRGATAPQARSGEVDAKHAQLMSAFAAATQSGDLNALTQLLASDVRVVTDGGGKVRAALEVVEGADRVARFLVGATRTRADAWWRDDFTLRFGIINGLPGVIVDAPEGPVQTAAFEIDGRRDSGGVRGTQSGKVAALGGRAARERFRMSGRSSVGRPPGYILGFDRYNDYGVPRLAPIIPCFAFRPRCR